MVRTSVRFMVSDRDLIEEVYTDLTDATARVADIDYTTLSVPELLELQSRRERLACAAAAVDHQILAALTAQTTAKDIGAKTWTEVLRIRLHISATEARRRIRDAENLGPRTGLTGEPLQPVFGEVAAVQAAGVINPEHVTTITNFFVKLPSWVDPTTRAQCEQTLVALARHQTPEELAQTVKDLLVRLDQDGPEPDDHERDRHRGIMIGNQQTNGLSRIEGWLTPEARALLEPGLDKLAAPGMCNPDDPIPCTTGTPSAEQITADTRTAAQRNHDALAHLARSGLASATLGDHNGFPVSVVVTTTLHELQQGAGTALTHTGTKISMRDLIGMASDAYCYLAIFGQHTKLPLYLGRTRRTATTAQRIALFARDRGCTKPNCTTPASRCQAHHICNWREDGHTDITNLALACGPDNRLADTGGWTTTMKNGRAHWQPPPLLDVGQPQTNIYHHPTIYPVEGDGESDSAAS